MQRIERLDEGLPDPGGAVDADVVDVEEQHDHTRPRVLRLFPAVGDRVRLASQILGDAAANQHPLELFDFLRSPALQDFEIRLGEIGDRNIVFRRRIGVDADVVRFGAKGGRRCLRRGLLRLRGPTEAGHRQGGDDQRRNGEAGGERQALRPEP